ESSSADYYKILRKQLNDSVISIKYPDDIRIRTGSLKVIYDIIENIANIKVAKAKTMMIRALSDIILHYNLANLVTRKKEDEDEEDGLGRMLVNDSNWIDRFLGIFRKIGAVDNAVHYDKDKEELDDVADDLIEKVQKKSDFIMPNDNELIGIIENETNTAVTIAVANMVDDIIVLINQGNPDPIEIGAVMENEFNAVNVVINDMIAKKIALHIATNDIPRAPYTPLVSAISLSYSSSKMLSEPEGDKVFQITPFGIVETGILGSSGLNPRIDDQIVSKKILPEKLIDLNRDYQGMAFLGVRDLQPNQNFSILVQLAEGPTTTDKKPPATQWFYLHDFEWKRMSNENIISDSSFGFQTTGIIEFSIPEDANDRSILFDEGPLFWLCAAVEKDTDAFQHLIDIKSQAVSVTFKDHQENPGHLALPLEAETIKTLIDDIPIIKKVSQPLSSFNGRVEENNREYYTRVSERLRHKSRAINNWDYERLILDEFPSFYQVKCLNNYYNGDFAIGHITVVPIADFRNRKHAGSNMLLPKVNYRDLRKIENYLSRKSSPFVKIHAMNPLLEHVLITCKVKFHGHVNKGFYLKRLNEDLINFLTPWAVGVVDTISFSAKVYASSIINFIDRQTYVNYVVDLYMEQYTGNEEGGRVFVKNAEQLTSLVETELKTGHSILVSAPKHEIELVNEDTKPIVRNQ
ncbi:MAG: baseplate J/gp47 family protein, partial [Chitinophagaceae bacterium]